MLVKHFGDILPALKILAESTLYISLDLVEFVVEAFFLYELVMISLFDELTIFEDDNFV